jgi:hypothetical protein
MENIIPDYTHVTQTISRLPAPAATNTDRILARSDTTPGRRLPRLRNRQGLARNAGSPYIRLAAPTMESPQVAAAPVAVKNQTAIKAEAPPSPVATECQNNVERMAGSLTCTQFLERFGDKYCKHDYIKRNCCASHSLMCKPQDNWAPHTRPLSSSS